MTKDRLWRYRAYKRSLKNLSLNACCVCLSTWIKRFLKSFVNDVGENSVCVWHPSKLKYEKLGISCVEDGVCTKLDAVLDGNELGEIKDNAWFHSSSA